MKAVLRLWFPRYLWSSGFATAIGAPLVWFGLDMPLDVPGVLAGIARGTLISLVFMVACDILLTIAYLRRKQVSSLNHPALKNFPIFSIIRTMTIHWLSFAVPLVLLWKIGFASLHLPVLPVELAYFFVVTLLISYVHAIVEYHSLTTALEPHIATVTALSPVWKIPLAAKIAGIASFVGIVPVVLLSATFYLKLERAKALQFSLDDVIAQLSSWAAAYTLVAIAVSVILVRVLANDIRRASRRLTEGFRQLAVGNHLHRVKLTTADEFEELAGGFNSMAVELGEKEKIYEEFGRLVDPSIRDEVLAGRVKPEGELRYGVALFCDIANFTQLSERLAPEELVSYLNDLLDRLVHCITHHNGTVNKFIGDALLAFWNLPVEQNHPELLAAQCAVAMQEAVNRFNRERTGWRNRFAPVLSPLQLGIGIHAGEMIAGTVGAEHRREYTVIGANVNLAARIQQHSRESNYSIIVSDVVAQHITDTTFVVDSGCSITSIGSVVLKGVAAPQTIFGIKRIDAGIYETP